MSVKWKNSNICLDFFINIEVVCSTIFWKQSLNKNRNIISDKNLFHYCWNFVMRLDCWTTWLWKDTILHYDECSYCFAKWIKCSVYRHWKHFHCKKVIHILYSNMVSQCVTESTNVFNFLIHEIIVMMSMILLKLVKRLHCTHHSSLRSSNFETDGNNWYLFLHG